MAEQRMFEIKVSGYGFTKKDKSDFDVCSFKTLFDDQSFKSDERFHTIGLAIAEMEFPKIIEIVLGLFSSNPLFIKVRRIGELYFLQPGNEENEGFLMFGGNEKILAEKDPKEIREEFFEQLQNFLKHVRNNEFTKGIEFNKVSQWHLARSKAVGDKLLFLREGMVTF